MTKEKVGLTIEEPKNKTIEYVGISLTVQYGSIGIKHFKLWQDNDVILEGNNENTNLRFLLKCLENHCKTKLKDRET